MQRVRIRGIAAFQSTPAEYMRDMLRHDDGKIESIWDYPTGKRFESVKFTAIVQLKGYTPDRWRSFGLVTDVLGDVGEYSAQGYTVDEWVADREQPSVIQLDLESAQRVAVRQCLAMHPRVYDGMGLCAQCQEPEAMADYQIVTMNGGTGDWNPPLETFEAGSDKAANTHAEEQYPDLEWYVLNEAGNNIND